MATRRTKHFIMVSILLLVTSGVGFVYNTFSSIKPHHNQLFAWSNQEGLSVDLIEAKRAFDLKTAVFIDVRPRRFYIGSHIPGALNLSLNESQANVRQLLSKFPADTPIVTYCDGGDCQSSTVLAELLARRLGYINTRFFHDGWHAWVSAKYPTTFGGNP